MAFKDYYKTLGVEKNAAPEDIKKAYRKLAVRYHPDKNKNDSTAEARFKDVNEANSVLSDPEKRKRYDMFGENWEHAQQEAPGQKQRGGGFRSNPSGRQGQPFSFDASDFENDENFEDLFSSFFGGRQGSGPRARNGADIEADVVITLDEAFNGTARMLSLGTEQHRLELKKGVRDLQQFRLRGKGHPGQNGGKNGDLLINVRLEPHPRYTRKGNDLHCKQTVGLLAAVLGGKAHVQTMHGEKIMTLLPGTQYGATLRMRGLGMPVYDKPGTFGDLYVEILVEIPSKLSPEEREGYEKLAAMKG